ncbi:hypothetical protein E2562_030398, partial [Oryza meyeriana var. granulata]
TKLQNRKKSDEPEDASIPLTPESGVGDSTGVQSSIWSICMRTWAILLSGGSATLSGSGGIKPEVTLRLPGGKKDVSLVRERLSGSHI